MTSTLLTCTPAEYFALPGLSASIAHTLVTRSPLHAWQQHPLLGNKSKPPTRATDRGAVMHALLLGVGKAYRVLDFDDWRTKRAQTERDEAREAGDVPILTHQFDDAFEAAIRIAERIKALGIKLDGTSEQAITWEQQGVVCRGMLDHLSADQVDITDLKIVEDASPEACMRSAERYGYAIQAHAYTTAVDGLGDPGRARFTFLFCEPEPPYAVQPMRGDGVFREIGRRRWERAVHQWGVCERRREWPGYSLTESLRVPQWVLSKEGYE